MKWNSTITAIGSEALDPADNIVILFDNKATDKLRDVAVLQEFDPATDRKSTRLNSSHPK